MGRHALARHAILLDGALDRWNSEVLYSKRETEDFAGVAAATDESPPSAPRFRGLRFQVSVFYLGVFLPLSTWDSCKDPPIQKRSLLADIMQCPGKKGVDVSRILEKQLGRIGLNCFDVVSCTGDFENLNPGYARRRCLSHIA